MTKNERIAELEAELRQTRKERDAAQRLQVKYAIKAIDAKLDLVAERLGISIPADEEELEQLENQREALTNDRLH